jgi:uncharacterized protein (TIGR02391 family)
MATIKPLKSGTIESICKLLGETHKGFTGSEITNYLKELNIADINAADTKWKRLYSALFNKQNIDRCSNNILAFLENSLNPVRYYNREEWFSSTIYDLNKILSFEGFYFQDNGTIIESEKSSTINQANARASNLKERLILRKVHPEIYKFCREELLVDNYFHSVFEATKSVAEKIRNKSGLSTDGSRLVDDAFSFNDKIPPHLALNKLQSETEKSEQTGFMNLVKGLFGMFRNTTAHAPKITWKIEEQDALDILSMTSLIHRRLDVAIEARKICEGKI